MHKMACRSLVALITAATIIAPTTAVAAPPNFDALLLSHPYLRTFTTVGSCEEAASVNSLSGGQLTTKLDALARAYDHINGQQSNIFFLGQDCIGSSGTTLASKLVSRGIVVSNYRNGSFVSQAFQGQRNFHEAGDLEAQAPLSIGTFWPGNRTDRYPGNNASPAARLVRDITAGATTIDIVSAASVRPAGKPVTWPYVNSRGTGTAAGATSQNTHDFVSWIRVDNELMQVVQPPVEAAGVVTLTVRRGLWGTTAAPHSGTTRVMSPVYIGNPNISPADLGFNGAPSRDDPASPLRYAVKIWQPGGYGWIGDRIATTFGPDFQGYNGVWLDVSSCFQYNQADAYGVKVVAWNDPAQKKMTVDAWGGYQRTKVAALRARFPSVTFVANNFVRRLPGLENIDACNEQLISSYDGGVFEHWLKGDPDLTTDWMRAMEQHLSVQTQNLPALYWVRTDRTFSGDAAMHRRFAYGSMLLGYRPSATRSLYGSQWGLKSPQQFHYWDWGSPLSTPASVADLKVSGLELYRRNFENGIILVNPSAGSITYQLNGTYYDVMQKDVNGDPKSVTSVTIPSGDAAFLLAATP
jgi:hypothetical protein